MQTISVKVPESIYKSLKELAQKDQVSIDQFVSSALSEKISAFMTQEYLAGRAKRGSKKKFWQAMSKVPDTEPADYDQL
jgi:hypothetical protein